MIAYRLLVDEKLHLFFHFPGQDNKFIGCVHKLLGKEAVKRSFFVWNDVMDNTGDGGEQISFGYAGNYCKTKPKERHPVVDKYPAWFLFSDIKTGPDPGYGI